MQKALGSPCTQVESSFYCHCCRLFTAAHKIAFCRFVARIAGFKPITSLRITCDKAGVSLILCSWSIRP